MLQMDLFNIAALSEKLDRCAEDMQQAAKDSALTLDAQIRAYDLLDTLLCLKEHLGGTLPEGLEGASSRYCAVYEDAAPFLENGYDEKAMKEEAQKRIQTFKDRLSDARFEAAAAASLHEFAKEVFEIWQTSGIFARRRALRELRERAGFRLESKRIGNYVAKTFDLMNEAQTRFSNAQQAVFSADVSYKIKPGLYEAINKAIV